MYILSIVDTYFTLFYHSNSSLDIDTIRHLSLTNKNNNKR